MKAVPCLAGTLPLVTVLDPGLGLGVSPVPAVSGVDIGMGHKEVYNIEKATVCKQQTRVSGGLQGNPCVRACSRTVARNFQVGALSLRVLGRGNSKGQSPSAKGPNYEA